MSARQRITVLRWSVSLALVLLIAGSGLIVSMAATHWIGLISREVHGETLVFRYHVWTRAVVAGVLLAGIVLAWRMWPHLRGQALLLPLVGWGVLVGWGPTLLWDRVDLSPEGFSYAEHRWSWLGPRKHAAYYRFKELEALSLASLSDEASLGSGRCLIAERRSAAPEPITLRLVLEAACPRVIQAARQAGVRTPLIAADAEQQLATVGNPR